MRISNLTQHNTSKTPYIFFQLCFNMWIYGTTYLARRLNITSTKKKIYAIMIDNGFTFEIESPIPN